MAGHSQFKNIMYRKGAQDAKRSKLFTKIIRELTTAARQGLADPNLNPRLRSAIQDARTANMPRDTIERAIKRGSGNSDDVNYEEIRYEGYGPGGVAVIVEALTDNRNRTASEVRTAFTKHGGNLGETNSVSFLFQKKGLLTFPKTNVDLETIFDASLEAGAENVEDDEEEYRITCTQEDISKIREILEKKFGTPRQAKLVWIPHNLIKVNEDNAAQLLKLIETLEDNDDVQNITANFDIEDDILNKLTV
ncbi:MAG: YebC/PmpR family DNA-binding transcriptional regulator [Alphaproteobacteria bacterium]|nr:YebC/PmpR family DNA-binding transcriptional regulator [Alphaproteobacteria bacterium]